MTSKLRLSGLETWFHYLLAVTLVNGYASTFRGTEQGLGWKNFSPVTVCLKILMIVYVGYGLKRTIEHCCYQFPHSSALLFFHCTSMVKYHSILLLCVCAHPHLSTAKEMSQKPKHFWHYTFEVIKVKWSFITAIKLLLFFQLYLPLSGLQTLSLLLSNFWLLQNSI